MRAVITVIGKDTVGILAKVSAICAEYNANIIDVTQTVMQDLFAMIMLAQIDKMKTDFTAFSQEMEALGKEQNLSPQEDRNLFLPLPGPVLRPDGQGGLPDGLSFPALYGNGGGLAPAGEEDQGPQGEDSGPQRGSAGGQPDGLYHFRYPQPDTGAGRSDRRVVQRAWDGGRRRPKKGGKSILH